MTITAISSSANLLCRFTWRCLNNSGDNVWDYVCHTLEHSWWMNNCGWLINTAKVGPCSFSLHEKIIRYILTQLFHSHSCFCDTTSWWRDHTLVCICSIATVLKRVGVNALRMMMIIIENHRLITHRDNTLTIVTRWPLDSQQFNCVQPYKVTIKKYSHANSHTRWLQIYTSKTSLGRPMPGLFSWPSGQ